MDHSEEGTTDDMLVGVPSSSYAVVALSEVAGEGVGLIQASYLLDNERPRGRRELADDLRCVAEVLDREADEVDAAAAAQRVDRPRGR